MQIFRKNFTVISLMGLLILISSSTLVPQALAASAKHFQFPSHEFYYTNEPSLNFVVFDNGAPFPATMNGGVRWNILLGPPVSMNNLYMSATVPNGNNPAYYPFSFSMFSDLILSNGTNIHATDANHCVYNANDAVYCGDNYSTWQLSNYGIRSMNHYEQNVALNQVFNHNFPHTLY